MFCSIWRYGPVSLNGKLACTLVKCSWILSTYVKEVSYAPVSEINLTSAKKMKENLDKSIDEIAEEQNQRLETIKENDTVKQQQASTPKPKKLIAFPCEVELKDFYAKLNDCKTKPAALGLVHPFSESLYLTLFDMGGIMAPKMFLTTVRKRFGGGS